MLKIRSKFGAHMIEKQEVVRVLLSPFKTVDLIAAVADQRPKNLQNRFTLPFIGRKAVFFTGVQKIALKMKTHIIFVQVKKTKRGNYSFFFHQLWDQ
jgi:Kdo2-lipid IVA lauroyltransferase/acyltransferase